MKTAPETIEQLNKILANELVAINQYFLHSKMLANFGFNKLAERARKESIEEMHHADLLTDRILQLGGLPNFQKPSKINIGKTPREMFESDLQLEYLACDSLREAICHMESVQDFNARELLTNILENEASHIDWIETQIDLIDKLGLENYLQAQL